MRAVLIAVALAAPMAFAQSEKPAESSRFVIESGPTKPSPFIGSSTPRRSGARVNQAPRTAYRGAFRGGLRDGDHRGPTQLTETLSLGRLPLGE